MATLNQRNLIHQFNEARAQRRRNRVLAWLFPPTDNWRARYAVLIVGLYVAICAVAIIVVGKAIVYSLMMS